MHSSFSHFNIKIEQHDRRIYIKIEEWSFECSPLGLVLPMSSSSGTKSSAVVTAIQHVFSVTLCTNEKCGVNG